MTGSGTSTGASRCHWATASSGSRPEVLGVVPKEAADVDRTRQGGVVAPLERREVRAPDLRLALGPKEVDAARLASTDEAFAERVGADAWASIRDRLAVLLASGRAGVVTRRHLSSPPSTSGGAIGLPASRRRTWRAFEPSNGPM